jgi:hypothetical protein
VTTAESGRTISTSAPSSGEEVARRARDPGHHVTSSSARFPRPCSARSGGAKPASRALTESVVRSYGEAVSAPTRRIDPAKPPALSSAAVRSPAMPPPTTRASTDVCSPGSVRGVWAVDVSGTP